MSWRWTKPNGSSDKSSAVAALQLRHTALGNDGNDGRDDRDDRDGRATIPQPVRQSASLAIWPPPPDSDSPETPAWQRQESARLPGEEQRAQPWIKASVVRRLRSGVLALGRGHREQPTPDAVPGSIATQDPGRGAQGVLLQRRPSSTARQLRRRLSSTARQQHAAGSNGGDRRRGSILRVAQFWNISPTSAAELCCNVQSRQHRRRSCQSPAPVTQAKQPVRRAGSIKQIAQRWRITDADAAEIAGNVESAQTHGDDTTGLAVTTDPRRTFACRRDTLDLVFQMPVAATGGDPPPTSSTGLGLGHDGHGLPTMFAQPGLGLIHPAKETRTTRL